MEANELIDENLKLQREVYDLLSHQEYFAENVEMVRNSFIDNYMEVIKICFKVNLNPFELQKLMDNTCLQSEKENYLFIARTVENEKSYKILNDFLRKYIILLHNNMMEM